MNTQKSPLVMRIVEWEAAGRPDNVIINRGSRLNPDKHPYYVGSHSDKDGTLLLPAKSGKFVQAKYDEELS